MGRVRACSRHRLVYNKNAAKRKKTYEVGKKVNFWRFSGVGPLILISLSMKKFLQTNITNLM